jgi:hypothetical protein
MVPRFFEDGSSITTCPLGSAMMEDSLATDGTLMEHGSSNVTQPFEANL